MTTTATATATTTAMTMTMTQAVTLQHLKLYSILIGVVAIVFWIWAIINTIQNDQIIDGGIISFLTVIISSIYIIYLTIKIGNNNSNVDDNDNVTTTTTTTTTPQNQNQRRRRRLLQSVCTARWIVGSHLFVTLNYFVGIIVSWKGKRIYSIIFTILWMISSYFIWYLMKQYRLSASNATSSSSLDDDADDADADDNNNNNNNNSNNDNDNDNNNDEVA
jgi:hypothetical protein